MRALGLFAVAGACSHPASSTADAARCPLLQHPSSCLPHGFTTVDISGTWTFDGTETDDHCATMSTNTRTTFPVTLGAFQGCASTNNDQVDDTISVTTTYMYEYASTTSFCVDAAMPTVLDYWSTQTQRCFPTNPTPDTITLNGTLTR